MTNSYRQIATLTMTSLAISAMSLSPIGSTTSSYGNFKSKANASNQAKVKGFISTDCNRKGQMKLQAFANEGNAEVEKYGELILIDQEDFSLLTHGSEENPDLSICLEILQWLTDEDGNILYDEDGYPMENPEFEYPWNNMKPEYISGNGGWGIGNAYPAGGMMYIPFSMEAYEGKISTPWLDVSAYDGTFVVEFKVKVTPEALANPTMPPAIIAEVAETNNMSPTWDMFEDSFFNYANLSTEWTTFRLIFQGGGPSTLCNIVGQGTSGGMYIDDVRVYSLKPYLATPVLRRHTDFTENSFVLHWDAVENADKYTVSVTYNDLYGNRQVLIDNAETTEISYKVEGSNLDDDYFVTVTAYNSQYTSLESRQLEVFDIIAPKMRKAEPIADEPNWFEGGVEEVISAFGYNYFAMQRRTAAEDGPFTITNEQFTDWSHPLYEPGEEYTKENPCDNRVSTLYYPVDINQQGWCGQNFQIYKDYICLCPFFYEASYHTDQSAWISPEFDLSKDGGKISVSMKLAAEYNLTFENYASCIVGLFNWNYDKGDYVQAETVYVGDLGFDWKDISIELNGGTSRSKIAFFAVGSYGDLYIDDIVISQNYKAGESFDDPFFFNTWQLAEQVRDPTSFEFEVPDFAMGNDIYQRAQAVRMHFNESGSYDGEAVSPFSETDFVSSALSGVRIIDSDLASKVNVRNGILQISNPNKEEISVTTIDGQTFRLGNSPSICWQPYAKGVIIVRMGASSMKVAL